MSRIIKAQLRRIRMSTLSVIRAGAILSATLLLFGKTTVAQDGQTTTKQTRPSESPAASGAEMYYTYCAVCHGLDGKGGGPATPALKDQVPDLTTLSQRHGGTYPSQYVESVLRFGPEGFPAHGNKEMPIWGLLFKSMPKANKSTVTLRITNLTQYLKTFQVK